MKYYLEKIVNLRLKIHLNTQRTILILSIFFIDLTCAAKAQIVPDATLPVNSLVTPQGNINQIDGGTKSGGNLFHSFETFSLTTGSEVFFNNALDIQNIFSRVTGNSISHIDGLIRANGTANLFLLNPNGIVFGPNAQLNIGGSFFASTAHQINFADGATFSSLPSDTTPLLTVTLPVGLQMGVNPGKIIVQGSGNNLSVDPNTGLILRNNRPIGLEVQDKTLALVSADIELNGGNLTSKGGRIELGGIGDRQTVGLNATDNGWDLGYSEVTDFRDIYLNAAASLDASGSGGGRIQIQGRNLWLRDGSAILSFTEGNQPGQNLTVRTTESIQLNGSNPLGFASLVGTGVDVNGSNNAGTVILESNNLTLSDGAAIITSTLGQGNGGDLSIRAADSVTFSGLDSNGRGSRLQMAVYRQATGNAGNLTLETTKLNLYDGAFISTATYGQGNAGDLTIRASESVTLSGLNAAYKSGSRLATSVESGTMGNGGNLLIETGQLTLSDRATITAYTNKQGNAGNLTIKTGQLTLSDRATITAYTYTQGNAGNLTIKTGQLALADGSQISAITFAAGNAGQLSITAETIELIGQTESRRTGLLASAIDGTENGTGTGAGGDVNIITDRLTIRDGATVSASNFHSRNLTPPGQGPAGSIEIQANSVLLDNEGIITAKAASGDQGNITVNASNIELRRGSTMITEATGLATGGNITINTDNLVALENSDINANAAQSFGGRVMIDANGIFGTAFRDEPTPKSDITATSALGAEFSGIVEINTEIDVTSGLIQLPENIVDATKQIDSSCRPGEQQSEFIVTGKGGIPPNPIDAMNDEATWIDLRPLGEFFSWEKIPNPVISAQSNLPLVEAQGWTINANGNMELVAKTPTATPNNLNLRPQEGCLVN
ncbi:two-partner secretion domain-containing protein [Planktothricoides raciborskii]|uniref:S-layer family protein n=1 Tax=Planktothricoides raciborskii FACHB-1370 TaxID=2949576 RepID=A0ABR8EEJ1_9CYAN|nr:S-layer family protein [Planktothricoides raciborskii]MBD2544544.1 S-layer family protein [Planktothricoides raciborskii FACHB-1370]MBD2585550.1 S-layer family protein [Planktothricoides raciborskii FACHB-1261]